MSKAPDNLRRAKYKVIFDKSSKSFQPGETISGIFEVISVHRNPSPPEICGIFAELEGRILVKDFLKDKQAKQRIIHVQKYIHGSECESIGPLTPGQYKFDLKVPETSPCTFCGGKIGEITYKLWFCVKTKIPFHLNKLSLAGGAEITVMTTNIFTFFWNDMDHEVVILPKEVNSWFNHEAYLRPMLTKKHITSRMTSGKILLSLFTPQQCYGAGDQIEFEVQVQNSGGKHVKKMEIQLQQIVTYNFSKGKHKEKEKLMVGPIVEGPEVRSDTIQDWKGNLQIPSDIQPSLDDYSLLSSLKLYTFQYSLKITLEMCTSLISRISEEFPIEIGCPLKSSVNRHHRNTSFRPFPSENERTNLTVTVNPIRRRDSIVSLAPSLPDYDEAMRDLRFGLPSYSCLDLSSY